MIAQQFNAPEELNKIRQRKKIARKKHYHKSRLQKCFGEIQLLQKSGASYREIQQWLHQEKRIKVSHTTVMRFMGNR